jgi:hypothetical protein
MLNEKFHRAHVLINKVKCQPEADPPWAEKTKNIIISVNMTQQPSVDQREFQHLRGLSRL